LTLRRNIALRLLQRWSEYHSLHLFLSGDFHNTFLTSLTQAAEQEFSVPDFAMVVDWILKSLGERGDDSEESYAPESFGASGGGEDTTESLSQELMMRLAMAAEQPQRIVLPPASLAQIQAEIAALKATGSLGPLLTRAQKITSLLSMSTVECERAFSVSGHFSRRPRSSMTIETTNDLLFIHSYFKSEGIIP
jgi:hypothetical protein